MIHRLKAIPMTEQNYNKELNTIYSIAHNNGYTNKTIDKLIQQYNNKLNNTHPQNEQTTNQRCIFTYTGPETYKITELFQKEGLSTAFKTDNSLKNQLNNCIDRTNTYKRSGVYKLTCSCEHTYIGQTGRNLETRYTEHIRSFRLNTRRSNYANHVYDHGHELTNMTKCMTLIHPQQKGRRLNILENMEIYKQRKFDGRIINKNILDTTSDTIFKPLDKLINKRKTPTDGYTDITTNKKPRLEHNTVPPYKRKILDQSTILQTAKRPRTS
uniref:GIY-YIG domain-containing protein n=1 Tax=Lygus hesperus TaxID=30085 RepID=A0A0K8T9H1_LYGHE